MIASGKFGTVNVESMVQQREEKRFAATKVSLAAVEGRRRRLCVQEPAKAQHLGT